MDSKDTLMYWIAERERIRFKKENGMPKPWSVDPVFHQTYFCNVRREDDKVTRWIRKTYNCYVGHPMYEFNIILARFLNWPDTLEEVGYIFSYEPNDLFNLLDLRANLGQKVWGNAYVVTTHGIPMSKARYLTHRVMNGVLTALQASGSLFVGGPLQGCRPTLAAAYSQLMRSEGLGSFMAAQVVADLKNSPQHMLSTAPDWWTFVAEGPGSKRGVSWFLNNESKGRLWNGFLPSFMTVREFVDEHWDSLIHGNVICNQDLQNCLCEYDKYMRVREGTGRSKRRYDGC